MNEPIKTTVVRWKCPHCNRHHSKQKAAVEHIARCWRNPENRACLTCRWRIEPYSEPDVGIDEPEGCELEYAPADFPNDNCQGWELASSAA